ncbi:MAG TPA: prolipoprotein diacylglyceryl transferase family protein [Acidimicrobiales bacterium]|nr:prolipoprotein diacylglyceryl transferase family protein [Acidimicrobiales bacterium]
MSAVPTSVHLGPLTFHLYGFGLAVATYAAYLYARRRLSRASINLEPFAPYVAVLLIGGLVGARAAHIATNWSLYSGHLGRWFAVWQGGLASFGGLAVALPLGVYLQRRWWRDVNLLTFCDALVPAVVAGWALGRVLGPQFMVNGGGHLTHQWFGLHYHGQVGRRVPVPLIQGAEDGLLWGLLLLGERLGPARRAGQVTGVAMIVWGLVRALDERLLLGQQSHSGSLGVQAAGLALAALGVVVLIRVALVRRDTGSVGETAVVGDADATVPVPSPQRDDDHGEGT